MSNIQLITPWLHRRIRMNHDLWRDDDIHAMQSPSKTRRDHESWIFRTIRSYQFSNNCSLCLETYESCDYRGLPVLLWRMMICASSCWLQLIVQSTIDKSLWLELSRIWFSLIVLEQSILYHHHCEYERKLHYHYYSFVHWIIQKFVFIEVWS